MAYKLKELLELEGFFREKAKENQKIHGNTAPGRIKSLCQKSDEVIDTKKELAKIAGVSVDTMSKFIQIKEKAEREKKVLEMYLRAWNTQESIADMLGIDQTVVSDIIKKNMENSTSGKNHKTSDFSPYLYNIWSLGKTDSETSYLKITV